MCVDIVGSAICELTARSAGVVGFCHVGGGIGLGLWGVRVVRVGVGCVGLCTDAWVLLRASSLLALLLVGGGGEGLVLLLEGEAAGSGEGDGTRPQGGEGAEERG